MSIAHVLRQEMAAAGFQPAPATGETPALPGESQDAWQGLYAIDGEPYSSGSSPTAASGDILARGMAASTEGQRTGPGAPRC